MDARVKPAHDERFVFHTAAGGGVTIESLIRLVKLKAAFTHL
ncbi:hypothetical protein [uncultured Bradyrhizobium sp.]